VVTTPQLDTLVDELARRLDDCWEQRRTVEPLSETDDLTSPELAYAVQRRWTELREARGERVIGRKIGLTSSAMQQQMGVSEPDYGDLWASRFYPARAGRSVMPAEVFLQPRAEGELAFLLGAPLTGTSVTALDVLAATEAVAVAVEVVDSRITDWRIRLVDTIADNSSYGALTLGPWDRALVYADLRTIGMRLRHNGQQVVAATGSEALGHPARSVAWLANKLGSLGVPLRAGDIVLSGSLGRSVPVRRGDVVDVDTHGQPGLSVVFD
jgi:2-keto-4-pentenoate hydratase